MNQKTKADIRKWKIVLIVAIALLAGMAAYFFPDFTGLLEKPILDFHLRNTDPGYDHQRTVIVMIRDKSMAQIGNWPWPTDIYAGLLDGPLSDAKTVAFNVDFMSLGNAEGDREFAGAMQRHGNVILGARYLPDEDKLIYPRQELRESAAMVGIYQTLIENDGVHRQFQMYTEDTSGVLYPTYMHAILLQSGYQVQIDNSTYKMSITSPYHEHLSEVQLDDKYATWTINADAEEMEIYEYVDVQEGRVPADVFEDAIVLVGVSNASERRIISTPDGGVYSAVRAANQLHTALSGFSLMRVSNELQALLAAAACLLCGFAALLLPPMFSFLMPAGFTAVLVFVSHQLFLNGILYLPVAGMIIGGWIGYFIIAFIQIRAVSRIVNYTTIPLQQTFSANIESDAEGKDRIVRHLQGLKGLFQSAGLQLIEPLIDDNHAFVQKHKEALPTEARNGASVVIKNVSKQKPKHRVLVAHPKTDPAEPGEYTLLGINKPGSAYAVQSMVSLVRNASLYYKALQFGEEKHKMSFNMIKCMVAAIDAKDPITAGHSLRVAQVALQIAEKLNFTDRELEELELAAIVHDVGKIGIRDSILHKKGIFSTDEFAEMKTHPDKGISIMNPSGLSKNTIDAILNHHERPDGRGYPDGKTQDEVGVFAKIIKVSDVYDALLGERQYKKAWPPEKVCDLLYRGRGSEFDTEITDLFLEMVKPEGWTPPQKNERKQAVPAETHKKYMQYGMRQIQLLNGWLNNIQKESAATYNGAVDLNDLNMFFGMEWGEPFWASHFLSKRPYLLEYNAASESCHFALLLKGQQNGVIVYSFFRDFLTSGTVFLLEPGWTPPEAFRSPAVINNNRSLWDIGKIFIMQEKNTQGFDSVIAFITKYAFDNNMDSL